MEEYIEFTYIDKYETDVIRKQKNAQDKLICVERKNDFLKLMQTNREHVKDKPNFIIIGVVLASAIIFSYIVSFNRLEIIKGIEKWYNLFFQFAIAYDVSSIFYLVTVFVPKSERRAKIRTIVELKIDELVDSMEDLLSALVCASVRECNESGLSKLSLVDINSIDKIDFSANSNVVYFNSIQSKQYRMMPISDYTMIMLEKINKKMDELLNDYSDDMTLELICIIEEVRHSFLHGDTFKLFNIYKSKVKFGSNNIVFVDYYNLIKMLKDICENNKAV